MEKMIHVVNVSQQLIPNVLPVLNEPKDSIEAVVICRSEQMEKQACWLRDFFESKGYCAILIEDFVSNESWLDLALFFDELRKMLEKNYSDSVFVLNLTGGNKMMSLALRGAFSECRQNCEYIYVETPKNRFPELWFLFTPENLIISLDKYELLIEDYLVLNGFSVDKARQAQEGEYRYTLTNEDCEFLNELKTKRCFPTSDFRYKIANKDVLSWKGEYSEFNEGADREFCDLLVNHRNFVRYEGDFVGFAGADKDECEKNQKFCAGTWLELYVYGILWQNRKRWEISDIVIGLNVLSGEGTVPNEIDVLFVRRGLLYFVECKAGKDTKNDGTPYRIEALSSNLGQKTNSWFVSGERQNLSKINRLKSKCVFCQGKKNLENFENWVEQQFQ